MAQNSNQRGDKLDGYVPVSERVDKFYQKHPEGRILTSVIEHDREAGFIMFRAEVYRNPDDTMPAATGHAYEYKDAGYVQKSSYIETGETSAIGRALAFLNFETKRGIASREEVEKAERHRTRAEAPQQQPRDDVRNEPRPEPRREVREDVAPVAPRAIEVVAAAAPAVAPPNVASIAASRADAPATDEQKEEMLTLLSELRPGDRRAQRTLLAEHTGKQSRDDLTRAEAARFVEDLRRLSREALP